MATDAESPKPDTLSLWPSEETPETPGSERPVAKATGKAVRGRRYKEGLSAAEPMLLPPSVDDYVPAESVVRAIAAYVDMLDLAALGFRFAEGELTRGRPSYAPGDQLKLYLYGYLNRVHSSRRLAAECERNLEVIWLLGGLRPNYHTIADFRKDNATALKATNREFVGMCRELGLIGGTQVGVDGSFFNGNASAGSIKTKKQLQAEAEALEREVERYRQALDDADAREAAQGDVPTVSAEQLAELQARAQQRREQLETLDATGETQISRTDPDARRLAKNGKKVTGYNVQTVVDAKHKLIIAHEVTNDGNDLGQLLPMAEQTLAALASDTAGKAGVEVEAEAEAEFQTGTTTGAETGIQAGAETKAQPLEVLADAGYFTATAIAACESLEIRPYVPMPRKTGATRADGHLSSHDFHYDAEQDVYHCPGEHTLRPLGQPFTRSGVIYQRYRSLTSVCQSCPLRERCLPTKGTRREIERSEHAEALERHRLRMAAEPEKMRQRSGLCEHPFGTLKRWLGWDHLLVRGFRKVRGEMAMIVHSYNLRRALNILGIKAFIEYCQERRRAREAGTAGTGSFAVIWLLLRRPQGRTRAFLRTDRYRRVLRGLHHPHLQSSPRRATTRYAVAA